MENWDRIEDRIVLRQERGWVRLLSPRQRRWEPWIAVLSSRESVVSLHRYFRLQFPVLRVSTLQRYESLWSAKRWTPVTSCPIHHPTNGRQIKLLDRISAGSWLAEQLWFLFRWSNQKWSLAPYFCTIICTIFWHHWCWFLDHIYASRGHFASGESRSQLPSRFFSQKEWQLSTIFLKVIEYYDFV